MYEKECKDQQFAALLEPEYMDGSSSPLLLVAAGGSALGCTVPLPFESVIEATVTVDA